MTEKYCPIPISTCEYATNMKADCENCDLNKRYSTRTIDNWETFIIDRETGKEYGYDVDKIIDLLNSLADENEQLKQYNNGAIELILDGIVEMYDGKRDYAETLFNKAIRLLKGDVESKNIFKCEYYQNNDDINVIGYCTNPVRHKRISGIALLYCQGNNCKLNTKEKWW